MSKNKQMCSKCRYLDKCFATSASPRNVTLNILACRIRNSIDKEASSKLLLDMVRPGIVRLIANARDRVGSGYIDVEALLPDIESRVIESLISNEGYRVGERSYLSTFWFGSDPRTGWIKKWIMWGFSKDQRFYKRHTLFGDNPKSDSEEEISETDRSAICDFEVSQHVEPDESCNDAISAIKRIIDDGISLNTNEYRVISFCMAHANESNKARLIDGTHTYLAEVMGVSRPRITHLFFISKEKLKQAAIDRGIQL